MKKIITVLTSLFLINSVSFCQLTSEPHPHGIVTFISDDNEILTGYVTEYDEESELFIVAISNSETEYAFIPENRILKFLESIDNNVAYTFSKITVVDYYSGKVIVSNIKEKYNLKLLPNGFYTVITDEYQLPYTRVN